MNRSNELNLKRHDDHNLELKSSFRLEQSGVKCQLDLTVFVPQSLQTRTCPKPELRTDFRSRVRLSFPSPAQGGLESIFRTMDRLEDRLGRWCDESAASASRERKREEVFTAAKALGAIFGEALKTREIAHRRELLLIHSRASTPIDPSGRMRELVGSIIEIHDALVRIRALIARWECRIDEEESTASVLELLDQYTDALFTDFLYSIRSEFDRIRSMTDSDPAVFPVAAFGDGWKAISDLLSKLQIEEGLHAGHTPDGQHLDENEDEREVYLLRLSQLKKFFQSEMFVDVVRSETIKKISEPLAAGGAAFGAFWAVLFQRAGDPTWVSVGFRGSFLICFGVAFYVLRDRLKDWSRAYFTRRVAKYLPDLEEELHADGRRIGVVKEWFGLIPSDRASATMRTLRKESCITEAERHLPEDVIHYRRRFEVRPSLTHGSNPSCIALQEVLRVNLERYLKHMDDAYKTVRVLKNDGTFAVLRTHRVYHIHIGVEFTMKGEGKKAEPWVERQLYRVILDKNGIVRVVRVEEEKKKRENRPTAVQAQPMPVDPPLFGLNGLSQ